jgi:hypothetical protein
MPNLRARRQPVNISLTTLIARPLLAVTGITRTASGAILTGASVKAFKSTTDVFASRERSDATGAYTVSVPDANRYYVVATQPATVDATVLTMDNTSATMDRTRGVGGVTENTLVGAS